MRCLLAPLGAPGKGQTHHSHCVDDLTTMKTHLASKQHESAMLHFNKLKEGGMAPAEAAAQTVEWAEGQRARSSISAAHGLTTELDRINRTTYEVALLLWAAEKSISFEAFESEMLKLAHKVYKLRDPPSADRLSTYVLETAYRIVQAHQDEELQKVDFFSITADAATLKYDKHTRYVALTLHTVLPDFSPPKAHMLALIPVHEHHTWRSLTSAISSRLAARLPDNAMLVTTVTDQGANFVKMAASLHMNLDHASVAGLGGDSWEEPLPNAALNNLDPTATHVCVAHRMNNAALDLYKLRTFNKIVDEVRDLVTYIRGSSTVYTQFMAFQTERLSTHAVAAQRQPKMLVLDVKTRWLYTHEMLARFVECSDDILRLGLAGDLDGFDGAVVTFDKLAKIRMVVSVLEPAADFVRLVEGDAGLPLARVPVLLAKLLKTIAPDPVGDVVDEVKEIKRAFTNAVMTRLGEPILRKPNIALAAAALHPAYGHLRFVSEQTRDAMWRELAQWAVEFPRPADNVAPGNADVPQLPPSAPLDHAACTELFRTVRRQFEEKPPANPHDLRDDPDQVKAFDALKWWKAADAATDLKKISHIARLVLATPASSAASERVFSAANLVVTQQRNRLQEYKVEQLTMVRHHATTVGATAFCQHVANEIERLVKADLARREEEKKNKKRVAAAAGIPPPDPRRQSAPGALAGDGAARAPREGE